MFAHSAPLGRFHKARNTINIGRLNGARFLCKASGSDLIDGDFALD